MKIILPKFLKNLLKEAWFYFLVKKAKKNIGQYQYRHLRARILAHFISRLHTATRRVDYHQKILITPEEDFIYLEGVFLTMKASDQYLKFGGTATLNQGKIMHDFLTSKGIKINSVIDLGGKLGGGKFILSQDESSGKNFGRRGLNRQLQNSRIKHQDTSI